MTHKEAVSLLAMLSSAYPQTVFSEANIAVYANVLSDLPYDTARQAAITLICESKFLPSIAEIREETISRLPGASIPSVHEAWSEFHAALNSRSATDGHPNYSHPSIEKAARALGNWYDLCMSESPSTDRAHFMRLYTEIRDDAWKETIRNPQILLAEAERGRELT